MNSIFLYFLLAGSLAVSSTVAISPAIPGRACDEISAPATEKPYYSIWVNTITGKWDCATDDNRAEAVATARKVVRFFSDAKNLHGCRELHTTQTPGYFAVVRAVTRDGYRFGYVFGAASSAEARRNVMQLARDSGLVSPEFITAGSL